jgi:hypothetical protein
MSLRGWAGIGLVVLLLGCTHYGANPAGGPFARQDRRGVPPPDRIGNEGEVGTRGRWGDSVIPAGGRFPERRPLLPRRRQGWTDALPSPYAQDAPPPLRIPPADTVTGPGMLPPAGPPPEGSVLPPFSPSPPAAPPTSTLVPSPPPANTPPPAGTLPPPPPSASAPPAETAPKAEATPVPQGDATPVPKSDTAPGTQPQPTACLLYTSPSPRDRG